MTASELLQEVISRGILLFPDGKRLCVSPKRALSEELLAKLREHKAELLRLLASEPGPWVAQTLGGQISADPPTVTGSEILTMHLDDFASAKLITQVRSEVLGESVIIASDSVRIEDTGCRVIYRAQELRRLIGLGEREIRSLHQSKKFYGANIYVN